MTAVLASYSKALRSTISGPLVVISDMCARRQPSMNISNRVLLTQIPMMQSSCTTLDISARALAAGASAVMFMGILQSNAIYTIDRTPQEASLPDARIVVVSVASSSGLALASLGRAAIVTIYSDPGPAASSTADMLPSTVILIIASIFSVFVVCMCIRSSLARREAERPRLVQFNPFVTNGRALFSPVGGAGSQLHPSAPAILHAILNLEVKIYNSKKVQGKQDEGGKDNGEQDVTNQTSDSDSASHLSATASGEEVGKVDPRPHAGAFITLVDSSDKMDNGQTDVDHVTPLAGIPTDSDDAPVCAVCLAEFVNGDQISALPCRHEFHHACIVPWLREQPSCPLCKRCIVPAPGTVVAETALETAV